MSGVATGATVGGGIGSIFGPIGTAVGMGAGAFIGGMADLWNLRQEEEKRDYDRALQQEIFAREDTAVQRRAADLEAAGLSKTLAAGSAAQAGSVVRTEAPSMKANNAMAGAQLAMQVAQTKAGLKLNDAQIKQVNSVTELNNAKTAETVYNLDLQQELRPSIIRSAAQAARSAWYKAETDQIGLTIQQQRLVREYMDTQLRLDFDNYLRQHYGLTEGEAAAFQKAAEIWVARYKMQEAQIGVKRATIAETWERYEALWYTTQRQVPGSIGHVTKDILSLGNILQELWARLKGDN